MRTKMQFSETNRKTLMVELHRIIEERADEMVGYLLKGHDRLAYPPNGGLTEAEADVFKGLENTENLRSALRKSFADNSSYVLFQLFNIIDGTGDPDPKAGEWSEVVLVDRPDDYEIDHDFLHDEFFESYDDWKAMRPKKDWALDNTQS